MSAWLDAHAVKGIAKAMLSGEANVIAVRDVSAALADFFLNGALRGPAGRKVPEFDGRRRLLSGQSGQQAKERNSGPAHICISKRSSRMCRPSSPCWLRRASLAASLRESMGLAAPSVAAKRRSLVPLAGIEPALLAELDFESSASTSSATGAFGRPWPDEAGGI